MPARASRLHHRRFILALALGLAPAAAVTALPGAALADPPAEPRADTDTRDAEVTNYRFDEDLVRGTVPAPTAEHLYVRRRNERESLIRVRTQFVRELLKSAEQL